MTVQELKQLLDSNADIQVIDVREQYEVDICTIGGLHIPMGEVMDRVDEISKDKTVVVHCRSGMRSNAVIESLVRMHGFTNLQNLDGGIIAYAREIDSSLEQY